MTGSAPTNSQAVDFEKQQAAEADQKEADRQARLTQGQTLIDQIFNGAPVMGTKTSNYDWSSFTPGAGLMPASGMPAGYTAVRVPAATTAAGTTDASGRPTLLKGTPNTASALPMNSNNTLSGYAPSTTGAGPAGASTWGLEDASGKIYKQGDPLSITSTYDTGQKTGGFDDAFYNNYKQQILDYYQPDEQRQYDQAQRDLTYNLARAGTLQSSTAADKQGDLAYNDALQKANIVANANAQTGNLQNQIQSNKQDLINQLYATDDPTLTANLAESSAKASQLQDPTLTPAASLFTPALTAVGSAANSLTSPYSLYTPGATPYVAPQSPTPASSNASSGKTTYG
jgi:hypothetical protein